MTPVQPSHHARLREIHRLPEVSRWWKEPADDWPADDPDTVGYAVVVDDRVVGFAQWYQESDPEFRHAGLDLFLDGAVTGRAWEAKWCGGCAATSSTIAGFHRIVIDPESANAAAIACYRKVGFREVGIMREYCLAQTGCGATGS
ncbi:GNAT family N-acetyltransferase [Rhodococcus hoagii]|nr:GNAT family N-acetyltransferase [Prescottella equi]